MRENEEHEEQGVNERESGYTESIGASKEQPINAHCDDDLSARELAREGQGRSAGERYALPILPVVARRTPPADTRWKSEEDWDEADGADTSSAREGRERGHVERNFTPIAARLMRPAHTRRKWDDIDGEDDLPASEGRKPSASEQYAAFRPPTVTCGKRTVDAKDPPAGTGQTRRAYLEAHERDAPSPSRITTQPRPTNDGDTKHDRIVHFHLYSPRGPWGLRLKGNDPSTDPASTHGRLAVDRIKGNSWFAGTVQRGDEIVEFDGINTGESKKQA